MSEALGGPSSEDFGQLTTCQSWIRVMRAHQLPIHVEKLSIAFNSVYTVPSQKKMGINRFS